jgi:hypothetical protein
MIVKLLPMQIPPLLTLMVGTGTTFTVPILVALTAQPVKNPLTVYVVLTLGVTITLLVFAPVLQVKEVTPDAVNVAVLPTQTLVELTTIAGAVPTTIVAVFGAEIHPAKDLPVTV